MSQTIFTLDLLANVVLFSHPFFIGHQSMPRYTKLLSDGLIKRGYTVEVWYPKPFFFRLRVPFVIKKWLGYIDQYIIFPIWVQKRLKKCSHNTFFVFTDNSLGPWVPLVAHRNHVIHCHDFLAQRSALGEISEQQISWTGRQYQAFIRRGFFQGKNFISVSHKTRDDLHKFLPFEPLYSEVVYNGLTQSYQPGDTHEARRLLGLKTNIDLDAGYILHVGGNQWYKNRSGVIEIYTTWRSQYNYPLPLIMIGEEYDEDLLKTYQNSLYKDSIHFLKGLEDEYVRLSYAGASVFLFPSLEEGFGWPIAEAMASGCPVITTNNAPMTEVGGSAAFYISRRPSNKNNLSAWLNEASQVVEKTVRLSVSERTGVIESGLLNARRFDAENALDKIESIYQYILNSNKI